MQYLNGQPDSIRIDSIHKLLQKPFQVKDKRGVIWTAPANITSDGSSIPDSLQPIIGDPHEGVTQPAAWIHDHYCRTKERSQKDTHRIYRELVEYEMRKTFSWFRILPWKNKLWQYTRAKLMWLGIRGYNRLKHPDWK